MKISAGSDKGGVVWPVKYSSINENLRERNSEWENKNHNNKMRNRRENSTNRNRKQERTEEENTNKF